jgi:hypothetical protein
VHKTCNWHLGVSYLQYAVLQNTGSSAQDMIWKPYVRWKEEARNNLLPMVTEVSTSNDHEAIANKLDLGTEESTGEETS